MHNDLKLDKLETRRTFHLGNLCFKNVHCTNNTGIQDLFIKQEARGQLITRNATCNVIVPLIRTTVGHKSIAYRGPSFWNKLDRDIKIINKYATFTREWRKICCTNFENHPT